MDDTKFDELGEMEDVDEEGLELGPGDLILVVKDSGEVETYFGVDETNEEKEETRYLASFLVFALNDEGCRSLFERFLGQEARKNDLN